MESLRQGLGPAAPTYPLYQKKVVSEQAAQQPTIETGLVCEVGIWKQSESNEKKEDKSSSFFCFMLFSSEAAAEIAAAADRLAHRAEHAARQGEKALLLRIRRLVHIQTSNQRDGRVNGKAPGSASSG